jgi:hypothetical protein
MKTLHFTIIFIPIYIFSQIDGHEYGRVPYNNYLIQTISICSVFLGYDFFNNGKLLYYFSMHDKSKNNNKYELNIELSLLKIGNPMSLNNTIIYRIFIALLVLIYSIMLNRHSFGYIGNFSEQAFITNIFHYFNS